MVEADQAPDEVEPFCPDTALYLEVYSNATNKSSRTLICIVKGMTDFHKIPTYAAFRVICSKTMRHGMGERFIKGQIFTKPELESKWQKYEMKLSSTVETKVLPPFE